MVSRASVVYVNNAPASTRAGFSLDKFPAYAMLSYSRGNSCKSLIATLIFSFALLIISIASKNCLHLIRQRRESGATLSDSVVTTERNTNAPNNPVEQVWQPRWRIVHTLISIAPPTPPPPAPSSPLPSSSSLLLVV